MTKKKIPADGRTRSCCHDARRIPLKSLSLLPTRWCWSAGSPEKCRNPHAHGSWPTMLWGHYKIGTPVEYPSLPRSQNPLPDEYLQATALLSYLNTHLDNVHSPRLKQHIRPAPENTCQGSLGTCLMHQMTGRYQQIVKIIEHEFAISIDLDLR